MINRVTLVGHLGADPEIRRFETGALVAKFSVATSESYKDKNGEWKEQTEWHNVVMWRGLAERAEAQLKKGSLVYIDGKLSHRSWQDPDGNTRYATDVVAAYFRALSRKEEGANTYYPGGGEEPAHGADAQGGKSADEGDGLPF